VRLTLPDPPPQYKSPQQHVRAVTEGWGESNLYCANCDADELKRLKANTPTIDFSCPKCEAVFQLKGRKQPIGGILADAAYGKMREAILAGKTPNLLALHYDADSWRVQNLILIPHFPLSLAAVKKRPPLSPDAERHGWVGCNIILSNIPSDARIPIVSSGVASDPSVVRRFYRRLRPLAALKLEDRGWLLDVLNVVRSIDKKQFNLAEVYAFEEELSRLHPANRHVRDKIRQQLQILRDLGLLEFLGAGSYRPL
jgi:type II restriction enzyme